MAKISIKIPTSWNDVTVGQFISYKLLCDNKGSDDLQFIINCIHVLTGESKEKIELLPISAINALFVKMSFLNSEPEAKRLKSWYIFKGNFFKLNYKINELTAAQFIDISEFQKDSIGNLHKILAAVMLTKKGLFKNPEYCGTSHSERAKLIYDNMPISEAYPIAVFFCALTPIFLKVMKGYSVSKVLKMKREMASEARRLLRDGDGSQLLTQSQKEILQNIAQS